MALSERPRGLMATSCVDMVNEWIAFMPIDTKAACTDVRSNESSSSSSSSKEGKNYFTSL